MKLPQPDYVVEFAKWDTAANKTAVVLDQVHRNIGIYDVDLEKGFDWVTPCGKRLGDCTDGDLQRMAAWHDALSRTCTALLAQARKIKQTKTARAS